MENREWDSNKRKEDIHARRETQGGDNIIVL